MRHPTLAVAAAVLAALALPVSAGATIVVQKGMAGVRLGMSQARVQAILGEPLRIVHGTNDFGAYTELRYPHRVRVTFQGDVAVTAISTTGTFERTSKGIGVGSTEAEVQAKIARVNCETYAGFRQCYVGSFTPGARVTAFDIKAGRVTRVLVGFVID